MPRETVKPGEAAPKKGEYPVVGPRGGDRGKSVTIPDKGTTMPPTEKPGEKFVVPKKK